MGRVELSARVTKTFLKMGINELKMKCLKAGRGGLAL